MAKHTPGDWIVGVTVGKDGWPVFRLRDMKDPDPDGEEVKADRKLIEAAPALLAAIERLMDESCPFESDTDSCECGDNGTGFDDAGRPCEHIQARRAIAKAST